MNTGVISTITASSLLVSTALISSLYGGSVVYSTLTGNALTVLSAATPVMNVNRLIVSTIGVSTANVSTLVASTLDGFSDLSFSTLRGNIITISSLIGSSMNGGTIIVSSITHNNVISNTINGASVTASSIQFSNLNPTNVYGSTMTVNSMTALLTLSVSTINTNILNYSTIVVENATISNGTASTMTVSSLIANSVSATTYSVRQPVLGATVKKTSISYPNRTVMKTSGIRAILDGAPSGTQMYTFGPTVPNQWVAGFNATNTLAYSNDGLNWNGVGTTLMNLGRIAVWNGSMWVAVGEGGANSIAYSYNGINWIGLGIDTFASANDVAWNGSMWVAMGSGFHSIAYSYDGMNWTGLGRFIFTFGWGVAWNGTMWIAVGEGSTPIAYSIDGINWTGTGIAIFTRSIGVAWNGTMWVAMGEGTNSIAYSTDGIVWTGLGVSIFTLGIGVAWNGIMWVASGQVANTLAYSYDGIKWIGLGSTLFTFVGRKLAWNGTMWIAAGKGLIDTLAYSNDGIVWVGLRMEVSSNTGYSTSFNGARPHQITFPTPMLIATGSGTNTLAYSSDGITWTGSGTSIFSTQGNGVATNGAMWVATGSGTNTLAYSTTDIETPFMHLPFENSTYADVMGNSTVTATGSPAFVSGVRGSKAVNLTNTAGSTALQYIRGTWNGANNVTVSLWLNPQGLLSGTGQIELFMAYNGGYNIYINGTNNIVFVTNGMIITSSATLLTNAWYNIVAIGQVNGLCSLYLNNFLLGTATNSGGFGASTGSFGLGTTDTSTPLYAFNGYIDDFRLYNYAISMNQRITWRGLGTSVFSSQGNAVAWNGTMWVAVGGNTIHSIAYSYDGITWIGLGNSIFTTGNGVTWGGSMWVAVGVGIDHSIAYSYNGITWIGLGKNTFSGNGKSVAWNGSLWVAVGSGANSIAYSYDGISWAGLGTAYPFFTTSGNSVAWNGSRWVATGAGGNTILYSTDGITWTVVTSSCFTTSGNGVTWNGSRWIVVGSGGNTIGYSMDGSTWIGNGMAVISVSGSGIASNNGIPGTVVIQHPVVAAGSGANSLAYSPNGVSWTGLGSTIFSVANHVAWNGSKWLACGTGTNTLAYSYDGMRWTGLGATVFFSQGNDVAWNGSIWVAVGSGGSSIAYSADGVGWKRSATGAMIFTSCRAVAWNGVQWVAVGTGTNSIAYSADGIAWTAVSDTIFSTQGNSVCWTGTFWVAVGAGTNTIAYSSDGITWTGLGTAIFSTSGNGVCWNGTRWVAVGTGTNTLAYSANGTSWIGFGTSLFSVAGNGVCWTGTRFVAVGAGSTPIGYSTDGLTWYSASSDIFTQGNGVAGNSRLGATVCDSQITLSDSTTLDVVSDRYYNTGYTEMSATIQSQTPTVDTTTVAYLLFITIPSAPTAVAGDLFPAGASNSINVSFTYTTDTGGGVVTYFTSAIDTLGVQPTIIMSSTTSPVNLTTAVPGTTYRIQVYSSNSAGQSAPAVSASTLLFQVPPSVPQNYVVALDPPSDPTGIAVSFTEPAISGGVTSYTVTAYQDTTVISIQTGTALSYTFTGLTPGNAYLFSAVGTNTGGIGTAIDRSIMYPIKPPAPIITVEYGELNAVIIAEIPPEYDRTLIDQYEYSINNGTSWIVPIIVFDEIIRQVMYISGIVPDTTAQIVVRAHSVSGWSPASNMVSKYYPPLPTVPTITLFPTTPTVYIQWSPDPAYVASVLIDEYAYSIDNGASWTSFGDRNSYNLIIYNLVEGTTSLIVIRAYNASGWGPASNMISYYYAPPMQDITIELQPFILTANIISTFAPYYDVNAIDLAEYSIDNGNSWAIIDEMYGSVHDFYIIDIVPDTTIQVIVRVRNTSGSSSVSNMVSYYYPPAAGYFHVDNPNSVILTEETMPGDPNFPMFETTASILLGPESWTSTLRVGSCRIIYHVGGMDITINGQELSRDTTTLYVRWQYSGHSLYDADYNQTLFMITLVASNQYGGTDTLYISAELATR
jgi:hypothetical protein